MDIKGLNGIFDFTIPTLSYKPKPIVIRTGLACINWVAGKNPAAVHPV
jgi:hypothetical protein